MNTHMVVRALSGEKWSDSLITIKACGGTYISDLKVWLVPMEEREILEGNAHILAGIAMPDGVPSPKKVLELIRQAVPTSMLK